MIIFIKKLILILFICILAMYKLYIISPNNWAVLRHFLTTKTIFIHFFVYTWVLFVIPFFFFFLLYLPIFSLDIFKFQDR